MLEPITDANPAFVSFAVMIAFVLGHLANKFLDSQLKKTAWRIRWDGEELPAGRLKLLAKTRSAKGEEMPTDRFSLYRCA